MIDYPVKPEKLFTIEEIGQALEKDIKTTNCPAKIKKFKITVEKLADCD